MDRNERHVVAKRPQLRDDGVDELVMIAAREIGPPDRALKRTSPTAASCEGA